MVDVKFWGPSGWSLLHTLTLEKGHLAEKQELFSVFQDILPCKYCRQSTSQFVGEMPPETDLAYWLYKLHDRVNKKLELQHYTNPKVPLPVPSPPFEYVVKQYRKRTPKLGWDFLYSVAMNYDPKIHNKTSHERFWRSLSVLYPVGVPRIGPNYFTDVHAALGDQQPLSEVYARIKSHKSKCVKKTCRKTRRKSRKR